MCRPASDLPCRRRPGLAEGMTGAMGRAVMAASLAGGRGAAGDRGGRGDRPPGMRVRVAPGLGKSHQNLCPRPEALRTALEDFSNARQPGCPWELDGKAISDQVGPEAHGRAELLAMHGIKRC